MTHGSVAQLCHDTGSNELEGRIERSAVDWRARAGAASGTGFGGWSPAGEPPPMSGVAPCEPCTGDRVLIAQPFRAW